MNEFQLQDYATARSYADAINNNANNVMGIFDEIDNTMNQLYGENWSSCGAEDAKARYDEIRRNYEGFYQRVVAMKTHIYNVTASDEAADTAASQNVAGV